MFGIYARHVLATQMFSGTGTGALPLRDRPLRARSLEPLTTIQTVEEKYPILVNLRERAKKAKCQTIREYITLVLSND